MCMLMLMLLLLSTITITATITATVVAVTTATNNNNNTTMHIGPPFLGAYLFHAGQGIEGTSQKAGVGSWVNYGNVNWLVGWLCIHTPSAMMNGYENIQFRSHPVSSSQRNVIAQRRSKQDTNPDIVYHVFFKSQPCMQEESKEEEKALQLDRELLKISYTYYLA